MLAALLGFAAASVLIVLLPGPDTLVVVRNLLRGGRRRAASTVVGVLTGLVIWVLAASLGLSAMLRASHTGYDVLRYVGGAYLIWIGIQSLRSRAVMTTEGAEAVARSHRPLLGSGYVAGLATDLLNPKVGVFFVSFLPGFVPDSGWSVGWTTFALGAWYTVLTALYFVGLIALSGTVAGWMRSPGIRRRLDTLTGLVLVGFGVRLATEA